MHFQSENAPLIDFSNGNGGLELTRCCPPPAAHSLLLTHSRTVHFQSENALLIDFSKGNELPEKVRWKLR